MHTILCIEDVVELRQDIAEELEEAGYEVLLAGDGEQGLKMIIEYQPDLVLCDITMPRKDGLQLMKEVRSNFPLLADMPFILLSALSDQQRILDALRQGADAYFIKPVNIEYLLARIHASIRQMANVKYKHEKLLVLDI